jgi:hypothetical protein
VGGGVLTNASGGVLPVLPLPLLHLLNHSTERECLARTCSSPGGGGGGGKDGGNGGAWRVVRGEGRRPQKEAKEERGAWQRGRCQREVGRGHGVPGLPDT